MNVKILQEHAHLPEELVHERKIFWQQKQEENSMLFNGILASLQSWSIENDTLKLNIGETCYRDLLFSNRMASQWKHENTAYFSRALGISAIVQTSDDKIVLMQRSHIVGEYPNMLDVMGGHIDVETGFSSFTPQQVFDAIAREVCDEIGLACNELEISHCLGLLENTAIQKPELVFESRTECNEGDIRNRMKNATENFEYSTLIFIDSNGDSLDKYLAKNGRNFTPSAEGCLVLFLDLLKSKNGRE